MTEEIKKILDKFDNILKNYELDKKFGQLSVDSICHLFPTELIIIKDYISNLEQKIKSIKGSCKALGQKSNNQKQEIKRLYKQRDKFNKKYRYVVAEKENLVQYACDLEDKICNLNAKIDEVISEIEKELFSVRKITFTKYKSNEWNNCLSFNDDILPILNKLDKLKEEKDEN